MMTACSCLSYEKEMRFGVQLPVTGVRSLAWSLRRIADEHCLAAETESCMYGPSRDAGVIGPCGGESRGGRAAAARWSTPLRVLARWSATSKMWQTSGADSPQVACG